MENLAEHPKYQAALKKREIFFVDENRSGEPKNICSPSGDFILTLQGYGIVEDKRSGGRIADIKRNYSHFPYLWIQHPNGKEYLVCGEDYQGYTIINATDAKVHNFVPEGWLNGVGFCWISYEFDPETQKLKVYGCYWACPEEIVVYDFSDPDTVPLKELNRELDQDYEDDEEQK